MKFLIAIVLYRIERKLTPLLKTNLSVFANVFFSLNLFSSWIYFSWYSKWLVYLRGCCFLKMHFGDFFYIVFVLSVFWRYVTLWILKCHCCLRGLGQRSMDSGFCFGFCVFWFFFLNRESFWRDLKSILLLSSEGLIKHPLLEGNLLPQTELTAMVCRRRCDIKHRIWSTTIKEYNQGRALDC